jgi:uncharacterized protein
MVIDVRTVPAGHSVVSRAADLAGYAAELPALKESIACRAEIDRAGTTLYINLFFKGTAELECSRCLAPFDWTVSGNVRLTVKEQPGRQEPVDDDGTVDFYYDSRHLELDLGSVIYEEIMTALPLKPLCREACPGIKLKTGKKSAPAVIDPRWDALRKLKDRQ